MGWQGTVHLTDALFRCIAANLGGEYCGKGFCSCLSLGLLEEAWNITESSCKMAISIGKVMGAWQPLLVPGLG